jgi:hypothetical protein
MMIRYLLLWFALLAGAILNAGLRDYTYGRLMDTNLSHQLSVFPGMLIFGIIIRLACRRWPLASRARALAAGLAWLVMTEAFEVSMIVFLQHKPVSAFFDTHALWRGELWPLLLAWIVVAPVVFTRGVVDR